MCEAISATLDALAGNDRLQEGTLMPGAGRYERWLQNSRIGLIAAALAAAAILYGVRYFIGS
jgi:hypothetical protein